MGKKCKKRMKVAVIFGGCSSEYVVSLQSAIIKAFQYDDEVIIL